MDMVTDDERKWKHIMHDQIPRRCGKLKEGELASFDAQFFGMHGQQAKVQLPVFVSMLYNKMLHNDTKRAYGACYVLGTKFKYIFQPCRI